MIDDARVAEIIKTLRKEQGLTQHDLAERLDLSVNFINLIENGNRSVSKDSLEKIADLFNIPAYVLIFLASKDLPNTGKDKKLYNQIKSLLSTVYKSNPGILQLIDT